MAEIQHVTTSHHCYVGEDKRVTVTLSGEVVTGWAASWVLKRRPTDVTATLTKTTAAGGITVSSADTFTITLEPEDTEDLRPDTYIYELMRTDDGYETLLARGSFELQRSLHANALQ